MPSPPLERARPSSAREYQTLVRNRLIQSRLTPNAISLTGLLLCLVAAGLVFAEYYFLGGVAFILGSVCDTVLASAAVGSPDLMLAACQDSFVSPRSPIDTRRLTAARTPRQPG